ncbi:MAG: thioredoxin [Candidatus Cloacimonetes bacterium]|nr:thioredoxin [Candidatus Cloacimonadota bacterium]MCF7812973.1 thioredoxin [Candidatus Cloacimonadota bacterium]MCF7867295.1 thioredoxin [Candidatus Cloacimonadota bacterium]MCF7882739.1 thioredoxin [Candidatus Cloacimonadota bacterium]
MKKIFLPILLLSAVIFLTAGDSREIEHLNLESFKTKIFDYENSAEWNYEGELPAIIDFYADWCGPCKQVAPIMVELSEEYENKLIIYKVDTDEQQQLAGMFGIRSIPSILFIPTEGQPRMFSGAYPKAEMVKIINEVLGVE